MIHGRGGLVGRVKRGANRPPERTLLTVIPSLSRDLALIEAVHPSAADFSTSSK
jgi:hypothetical protein